MICLSFCVTAPAVADISLQTESAVRTSWYGPGLQGNSMANGNRFDMNDHTVVAHKSLPFGTKIRLENPENGRVLVVTVQDRGPYVKGRELDVSKAAAERLGFKAQGVATLKARVIN